MIRSRGQIVEYGVVGDPQVFAQEVDEYVAWCHLVVSEQWLVCESATDTSIWFSVLSEFEVTMLLPRSMYVTKGKEVC